MRIRGRASRRTSPPTDRERRANGALASRWGPRPLGGASPPSRPRGAASPPPSAGARAPPSTPVGTRRERPTRRNASARGRPRRCAGRLARGCAHRDPAGRRTPRDRPSRGPRCQPQRWEGGLPAGTGVWTLLNASKCDARRVRATNPSNEPLGQPHGLFENARAHSFGRPQAARRLHRRHRVPLGPTGLVLPPSMVGVPPVVASDSTLLFSVQGGAVPASRKPRFPVKSGARRRKRNAAGRACVALLSVAGAARRATTRG